MDREVISNQNGISLMVLFTLGSSITMQKATLANRDSWLATILALFFAIPIILIYSRILFLFPQKDLFEILEYIFGKFFGKILSLPFIWYAFHLGTFSLMQHGEFVRTVSLPETPIGSITIFFIILCIWGVKEGIEVLGRWSQALLVFTALTIIIAIMFLIPQMHIEKIQPILYDGIKPVMRGAFSTFSFPICEVVILLMIFSSLRNRASAFKVYTLGTLFGWGFLVFPTLTDILVLGPYMNLSTYFPAHSVISRISVGVFIQRLEIIVINGLFVSGFIKISICLLAFSKGIVRLFGLNNYRFYVTPAGLMMLNFSFFIYEDIMQLVRWTREIYPFYVFPVQVILPTIILIEVEIKKRAVKKGGVHDE